MVIKFDYSKLKGKIIELYGTQGNFSEKLKLSDTAVSNKLNNKVPFTQPEIYEILTLLGFDPKDDDFSINLKQYFFTPKVENVQLN